MLCTGCQRLERKVNVYVLPVHTPSWEGNCWRTRLILVDTPNRESRKIRGVPARINCGRGRSRSQVSRRIKPVPMILHFGAPFPLYHRGRVSRGDGVVPDDFFILLLRVPLQENRWNIVWGMKSNNKNFSLHPLPKRHNL